MMKQFSISILLMLGNVALANTTPSPSTGTSWYDYYSNKLTDWDDKYGYQAIDLALWERMWQTKSSIGQKIYKGIGWKYEHPEPLENPLVIGDAEFHLTPIEKNYDLGSVYCVNGIELRTGYSLDTSDVHFGEFSGMEIYPAKNKKGGDAMKLTAVSDRGNYWEAFLSLDDSDHTLLGLKDNLLGSIKGLKNGEYDIEDLAVLRTTDPNLNTTTLTYFISHELVGKGEDDTETSISPNQISAYHKNFDNAANRKSYEPKEIQDCVRNKGIEALGLHPTLGAITIHEYDDAGNNLHPLYQWKDNDFNQQSTRSCLYKSTDGFQVSGLTFLSDGTMLVLERWFHQYNVSEDYKIIVRSVSASTLQDALTNTDDTTQIIEGKQIIFIDKDAPGGILYSLADNFECIASIEHPVLNGKQEISIFLLSDDNRAAFQRTIMLQFVADRESLELKK